MHQLNRVALCTLCIFFAGCATKRYGRMQSLTPVEKSEYSCRDIRIEKSKNESFRMQVLDGGRFNFKTVIGFAGDFGIGNGMEKREALRTYTERRRQLESLERQKRCLEDDSPVPLRNDDPEPVQ